MTTLGIMIDRIADQLARDDMNTQIGDCVRSAVNHYAGQHWWFNEVRDYAITLTSSVNGYALPADFEHAEYYRLKLNGPIYLPIDQRHADTVLLWQTGLVYGLPTDYAILQSSIYVFPQPNASIDTLLTYVQTVSTLTTTTCTNNFMTYGAELIRARAYADVAINYLRDDGITAEYTLMTQTGLPFYTHRERVAYDSLARRNTNRIGTGRLRPSGW